MATRTPGKSSKIPPKPSPQGPRREIERLTLSNEELRRLAQKHPVPPEFWEEDDDPREPEPD